MKNIAVVFILLFINFIFLYTYSSRYSEFAIYLASTLFIVQFLAYKYGKRFTFSESLKNIFFYSILIFIIGFALFVHFKIPVETINVDRWSIIDAFISEIFNGNYPYYAKSNVGNLPGPMPAYFLVAMPFYFIGELNILSAIGYLLMLYVVKKSNTKYVNFLYFFSITSLFMFWEIITRSNILTFTMLVLLVLNEFKNIKVGEKYKFFVLALLTGFLLSTRSIYVLAYILFFLPDLLNKEIKFKRLFVYLFIAFISFGITFLPLILFFKNDFFEMNPFIIQSSFFVPKFFTIIFIGLALLFSFLVKNRADKFFYSSIVFFITVLVYIAYQFYKYDFSIEAATKMIDISYFIFCVPFLMMHLLSSNVDAITQNKNS